MVSCRTIWCLLNLEASQPVAAFLIAHQIVYCAVTGRWWASLGNKPCGWELWKASLYSHSYWCGAKIAVHNLPVPKPETAATATHVCCTRIYVLKAYIPSHAAFASAQQWCCRAAKQLTMLGQHECLESQTNSCSSS